jgi:RHS repeat-associated protein
MFQRRAEVKYQSVKLHPFGSCVQGRGFSSAAYRYGFNGKEKEADGTADNYDFGARIYDGRLGRFLSIDPKRTNFKSYSTYIFAGNRCIVSIDFQGEYESGSTTPPEQNERVYTMIRGKVTYTLFFRNNEIHMEAQTGKGKKMKTYSSSFSLGVINPFESNSLQIRENGTSTQGTGWDILKNHDQPFTDENGNPLKQKKKEIMSSEILGDFLATEKSTETITFTGLGYQLLLDDKGLLDLKDENGLPFEPDVKDENQRKKDFLTKRAEIVRDYLIGDGPGVLVIAGDDNNNSAQAQGCRISLREATIEIKNEPKKESTPEEPPKKE